MIRMFTIGAISSHSPLLVRRIVYLIGFLDLLSVSMFYPILIQVAEARGATPAQAGLLGSLYGILQILSSTRLGQLSDVYGRKLGLLVSFLLPAIGYLIGGTTTSLIGLFLSRITPGLFKHGISICKAYLADVTAPPDVSAVLGVFTTFSNAGFILGPLIGGYLSEWDPNLRAPLLAAGMLFLCIALLVQFILPEKYASQMVLDTSGHLGSNKRNKPACGGHLQGDVTIDNKVAVENDTVASTREAGSEAQVEVRPLSVCWRVLQQFNFLQGVHWRELADIIVERFLLTLAVLVFRNNLASFLKGHFHVDYLTMGKILSFNGLIATIAALLVQYLSRWYGDGIGSLLRHASLLLSASLVILTLSPCLPFVVVMLAPISLATSTLRIVHLDVTLRRGRVDEKGAIVGLTSSIASFSRALAPAMVGVLQEMNSDLPGYFAAIFALLAFTVMFILPPQQPLPWYQKHKED